jgi:DNA-binding response OmpR family regulator
MRILLVEDDPILALLAEIALEEDGHEVVGPAYDVSQAITLTQQSTPDFAFVDINLNGHDEGVDLVRVLFEEFAVRSLYVSGQTKIAKTNTGHALGLLSKPYTPDDLARSARIVHALITGDPPPTTPMPGPLMIFTESGRLYGNDND